MKLLSVEDRPLRHPLRQLRLSIRAGRPISWPNFRRLACRSGLDPTPPALAQIYRRTLTRPCNPAGPR